MMTNIARNIDQVRDVMPEERIPEHDLAELWFSFLHKCIAAMQHAFRQSGLQQKTIAARIGRSASFVSRCLSGQQNMTLRTIHDISRGMGYRLVVNMEPLEPSVDWSGRAQSTGSNSQVVPFNQEEQ
jgi:ribosome-binding protein aMBF1 (putative translation factor)